MSTVLLRSAAIPVPDPPPVTDIRTSGCSAWYFSAHASARLTMVSEPLFWMYAAEESDAVAVESGPHEESANSAKSVEIKITNRFIALNYSRKFLPLVEKQVNFLHRFMG